MLRREKDYEKPSAGKLQPFDGKTTRAGQEILSSASTDACAPSLHNTFAFPYFTSHSFVSCISPILSPWRSMILAEEYSVAGRSFASIKLCFVYSSSFSSFSSAVSSVAAGAASSISSLAEMMALCLPFSWMNSMKSSTVRAPW